MMTSQIKAHSSIRIIDAHAHCGVLDDTFTQTLQAYQHQIAATPIDAVAFFSPVFEIYDRYDSDFKDTKAWRQRRKESNVYLLSLNPAELKIFPYFFIWNDFAIEQLSHKHCGIKWHRHHNEPVYHYDDPNCLTAIEAIRRRNLPVVLEETFDNTVRFIRHLAPGLPVIIPHLGDLNGGYESIAAAGLWEQANVWTDTALACRGDIDHYLRRYGHQRLMFGSDFPFGNPVQELDKIEMLHLDDEIATAVLKSNFIRLQAGIVPSSSHHFG